MTTSNRITRRLLAFAAGFVTFSFAASASATSCAIIQSSIQSGYCTGTCLTDYQSNHPECFAGGTTTSSVSIAGTTLPQMSAVSNALASRFLPAKPGPVVSVGTTGMAAGDATKGWNAWGSVSQSDTKLSYQTVTNKTAAQNSHTLNTVFGGDYALSKTLVVGASAAFDDGGGTALNNGAVNSSMSTRGYSVAPYLGMQLSQSLALDASVGVGKGKFSTDANTSAEATRTFYGANLTYNEWRDNVQLAGKFGYLYGEEKYGDTKTNGVAAAGTAATNKVGQWRAGFQAAYWMNNGFMPYAGLAYAADSRSGSAANAAGDPIGKSAWVWSLGVNFFSLSSGVTGGIAYNQEESRSNSKNNTLMANINLRF